MTNPKPTMKLLQHSLTGKLEQLVEQASVESVLNALADLCWTKAQHIQSRYDDYELARAWRKVSHRIAIARHYAADSRTPGISTPTK